MRAVHRPDGGVCGTGRTAGDTAKEEEEGRGRAQHPAGHTGVRGVASLCRPALEGAPPLGSTTLPPPAQGVATENDGAPLQWIDENCVTFTEDSLDGPQSEHERVHSDYITLTERLLKAFLSTVGATPKQFYRACREHISSPDVARYAPRAIRELLARHHEPCRDLTGAALRLSPVIQQILALDDFSCFQVCAPPMACATCVAGSSAVLQSWGCAVRAVRCVSGRAASA